VTNKLEFLAQLPLFAALNEGELRALATICQELEYEDGAVIAYQRDVADSMVIVQSGRLFARVVDERGIVRDTSPFLPGDHFGDVWLFASDIHQATVKTTGRSRVILINGAEFLNFLQNYPSVLPKLEPDFDELDEVEVGLSPEAWAEAQKSRLQADKRSAAISLLADELVEYQARRSRWYLLLRIALPVAGLIFVPMTVFLSLGGQPVDSTLYAARLTISLLLALVFLIWFAFQTLDWSNDYFVITNKHLAHHEFSLRTFRTTVIKIPIDQVQSVEIERPSFIASLFNYGTARVTTAAQAGSVRFDSIDDPGLVEETLNRLRQLGQALNAGRAQATMRRSIESHFQVQPNYELIDDSAYEEEEVEVAAPPSGLFSFWSELSKRYRWRVEEAGAITYRKHFFVLLREIAWPAGTGASLLIVAVVVLRSSATLSLGVIGFYLLLCLFVFGWFVWQVEDWRNDTFQLTDRYVIDIDRRPFGFGESRKQAELKNVQNVNSDRPNLVATIFNYGNVVIETAGATADITFENVSHPNRIQSDIFSRRDQLKQRQLVKEGDQRRKEYSVLLDVYQQALEQDRIPRRTPPSEQS
jgi:uncharacterized membrane protein YdbT with pleckstrin-like domain